MRAAALRLIFHRPADNNVTLILNAANKRLTALTNCAKGYPFGVKYAGRER